MLGAAREKSIGDTHMHPEVVVLRPGEETGRASLACGPAPAKASSDLADTRTRTDKTLADQPPCMGCGLDHILEPRSGWSLGRAKANRCQAQSTLGCALASRCPTGYLMYNATAASTVILRTSSMQAGCARILHDDRMAAEVSEVAQSLSGARHTASKPSGALCGLSGYQRASRAQGDGRLGKRCNRPPSWSR
jgi:hypothetical protein